ncbi:long-chain fatty acid--CoA ligase [Nocardiopsis sp. HNM0947]|uniref:Acyl-CoA synthetase n=1 Tax=Nocardiopsis coralli TaxID=2772213 RepID=A0ABR9NZX7_9ACTN|nr:AMP-dependent synthetase/ligase [Nocardiopsis coralli]MBE2997139.1 long-chain fatty acid--CoA ligase [Nocardiopsis coralli]
MTTARQVRRAAEGQTIPLLLRRNAQRFPDHPALTSGPGPDATTWTWSRLRNEVAALTRGLFLAGLRQHERLLIAMSARPEHWVVDLAAIHLGALPCTTYETLSTEQIRYIAHHSGATVVVLEGREQLRRWQPVLDEMPHLRAVVVLDHTLVRPENRRFVSYAGLRGDSVAEAGGADFEAQVDAVTADRPLTLVYTSGTTGDPKGVVLSHRNVIYESVMQDQLVSVPDHPRSLAYLPLAHVAERVLGIYMPICNAGHVTICADQTQLLPALRSVRPNGFFGVPRVWEKLAAGLGAKLDQLPAEAAAAVDRARESALHLFRLRSEGREIPDELAEQNELLDREVLRPIRGAIGLDECHRAFSGAAPIPASVLEFLAGLGLTVYEVWGLSETTGAATVSTPEAFELGAVGGPGPGMEVTTAPDGELLVRGPVVFPGYMDGEGRIVPATDEGGWFPTGDIGRVDARGLVSITDRKKEIIITSGGKNVAPTKIESALRSHPLIAQAVAIGDARPYITALLVLDEDAAPAWARAKGIAAQDLDELSLHPDVLEELDGAVARANGDLARAEQVKAHRVLAGPWTAETGELTPKLSLKRRVVEERYADLIASLY